MRIAAFTLFLVAGSALAQPHVDSIDPVRGPIAGGTVVTIRGSGFAGASVKIDHTAVAPTSQSDSVIGLLMPQHDNGIAVISTRSATAAAYAEFLYVPPALRDLPPGYITTVAGIGQFVRDYGPAKQATMTTPWSLERAADGTIYVADTIDARILRIAPDGTIERFAGGGTTFADGAPATESLIGFPRDLALDGSGNAYIADGACHVVKVANGVVTTLAGNFACTYSGDGGPAAQATTGQVTYIAADATDIFFIDWDAMRVRRIHLADGIITTFAGNGVAGFSGDGGLATQASFNIPNADLGALALDPAGNLFLSDDGNGRIRRIDRTSGIITTFYKPTPGTIDDVNGVRSLAFDSSGSLYYGGAGRIVKVSPAGALVTTWGNGTYALPVDGVAANSTGLGHVLGIAIDGSGNIIYSDEAIGRVRRINVSTGLLDTIAGIGPAIIGENGEALATVARPNDLAFDRNGDLLLAETLRLRKLDATGKLTTVGGTGSFVGAWAPAPMNEVVIAPTGIDIAPDGTVDLCDLSVIDNIDRSGVLHWIVGHNADCSYTGDGGPATQATLCQAWDSVRDAAGNLFVADTNNNRIRRVDAATGIITTIAGNGGPVNGNERYGMGTSCGDGGRAIDACLNTPYGIAVDRDGSVFVAENHTHVRRIAPDGTISTFADANGATKLVFGPGGFLYTAQNQPGRFDRSGIYTALVASNGATYALGGDGGPAADAGIRVTGQAAGVAIDVEGNLFFTDTGNQRVRAVRYGAVLAPAGATIEASAAGSRITVTVRDAAGHPAPSVRVDFAVPSNGASCSLSQTFAVTDENGTASISCVANCLAGSYQVTATPLTAAASATVPFTNAACVRGDVDGDGSVTVVDIFRLIDALFAGGNPPLGNADANRDGGVNVADVFYLINYLLAGGLPPAP